MTTEEIAARFDAIDRQNADLLADIVRPEFEGDIMLDPTLNKAQTFIHLANEAVVLFPQGTFPLDLAAPAIESTNDLLAACEKRYGRLAVKPMAQAFRTLENLWYYTGAPTHPPELFRKKIFVAECELLVAIKNFSCVLLSQSMKKKPAKCRGRNWGERDETLHKVRAEVVAAIRGKKKKTGLSWTKCVALLRGNSAYVARMRGKSDSSWIRYAKGEF